MAFDTFKDLKKGDRVKYENVPDGTGKRLSGEGNVYGFGKFGGKDFVWIKDDRGKLQEIPYEEVKKV